MRFNVYKKIFFAIILLILAFSAVNLYSYYGMRNTIKGYEGLVQRSAPLVFDIKEMNHELYKQALHLSMYSNVQNPDYLKIYNDSVKVSEKLAVSIDKNLTTPEGKAQFAEVKQQYDVFKKVMDEYTKAINSKNLTPTLRLKAQTVTAETSKKMSDYSDFLTGRMALRTEQNKTKVDVLTTKVVLSIVVLVVIALLAASFFARLIAKPLKEVSIAAKRIADNDLRSYKINYKGNDEIRDLINSFEDMLDGLRATVVGITASADELAQASSNLNDNAHQTAESANQIATTSANIAYSRSEQIGYFDKADASAKEMDCAVQMMSGTVTNVTNISRQSVQAATAGKQAVKEAEKQMQEIDTAVEKSTKVISVLGESSQKVGDIIGVISDIASQTNLLALNAAIEAARAGEHGRGFAVVAEEVRKLAEQVAKSTHEISEIIIQIQNETHNAIIAMQLGSEEVEKGTVVISTTGQRFEAIVELIEKLQAEIEDIKKQTEKMHLTSEHVGESISFVKDLADKSSSDSQTIGAATEEQSATMQEVSASSRKLAHLADNLKQTVSRFKIV